MAQKDLLIMLGGWGITKAGRPVKMASDSLDIICKPLSCIADLGGHHLACHMLGCTHHL
jgi:hypothetical protein